MYTMELTISLNRVSFLPPPVRNNIFYEIETSSTGLYNIGLGAQSTAVQEGAGPRFGKKPLKTTENLGLGPLFSGVSKWAGTLYFYPSEIVYSTGRNY